MVNAAVVECYATLVDPFGSVNADHPTPHRGADYRRSAGQTVVAYEECTVIDSDLKSSVLGFCLVAQRKRDGKFIGWAHLLQGTRPGNGAVLQAGDKVGLVAGFNDYHGTAWSGPHIHTTEGSTAGHIYSGQNTDPAPDIAAARAGTAAGPGNGAATNFHWWQLTADCMYDLQRMMNALKIYGGVDGGTGPEDKDFGERSVKGMQELGKRWGFLAGDYGVDGVPHNADQNAPSNYGFFLQRWAKAKAGYDGLEDGLPGAYTSGFLSKAANIVIAEVTGGTTPPPVVVPPADVRIPDLPASPEGFLFFPDLGSSQGDFDFAEYNVAGGRNVALKFGGGNASDSPYIAPRWQDQLLRARAQQLNILHYWFNGNKNGVTPESSADFMATHIDLVIGEMVGVDVENETDTGTIAWTPDEVVRFIKQLRTHRPGINGLVYGSDSLLDNPAWAPVWALGWAPWDASWGSNNGDPGTPPTTSAAIQAWQYTSEETVPGNYSGNPKVYRRTDGNLGKLDTWPKFGWQVPVVTPPDPDPIPDPDPEPTPDDGELRDAFQNFLKDLSQLSTEYATSLESK